MSDPDSEEPAEVLPSPTFVGRLRKRLRRIADWRRDEILRKLYRNASMLVLGEGFAALLGLVALGLTTRALGVSGWGVLATVIAFTHLVGSLVKFQTWQAVVKFGADALARDDKQALGRLVRFTTLLDLGTALIAAGICVVVMPLYLSAINVDPKYQEFAIVYSAAALLTVSATPVGILRLFDRFDILSMISPISAALRVIGCTIMWFEGGGIWHFGMVWLACALADRVLLVAAGWRELHRRGLTRPVFGGLRNITEGHQGLWRFAVAGNLQSSLNALNKEADTLLVGAVVGAEAAGLWVLAKRFSSLLSGPARMFIVSIFPQLAKLWAAHDYRLFRRLILRSSATGGAIGILTVVGFALVGQYLIHLISGEKFTEAYLPTLLLMASRVVTLFGMPMNPAMLAMNRPMKSLRIAVVTTLIYWPILLLLASAFGLKGAGFGRILSEALPFSWLTTVVLRSIRAHMRRTERLRA